MQAKRPKIYLAGPEVFFPDPASTAASLKEICAAHGLEGRFPTDADYVLEENKRTNAELIYHGNVRLLDDCDCVIANMTPFRGVSMDVGTAFEIGYAIAQDKPVFGWSETCQTLYIERTESMGIDDGMSVENFEITDNLMVVIPLQGGRVHPSFASAATAAGELLAAKG